MRWFYFLVVSLLAVIGSVSVSSAAGNGRKNNSEYQKTETPLKLTCSLVIANSLSSATLTEIFTIYTNPPRIHMVLAEGTGVVNEVEKPVITGGNISGFIHKSLFNINRITGDIYYDDDEIGPKFMFGKCIKSGSSLF
jgi:hypothetical protein